MADPTLATRPLIPFLQEWLARHAGSIRDFAQAVGLEPSLIAAGPLQEASTIIGREFSLQHHQIQIGPEAYERVFDLMLDSRVSGLGHKSIAADFAARKSDILAGKPVDRFPKLWHPTGNDIGYANINLGTAILYLQRYLQHPEDYLADPSQAVKDPLKLRRYANDYARLAADLSDPRSNAAWAIAALVAKDGHNIFSAFYGPQFTQANEAARAAYVTTFYKQGEAKILQKKPDAHGLSPPSMHGPEEGSGGPFTLDNFETIKQILGRQGFRAPFGDQPFRLTQPAWSGEHQVVAVAAPEPTNPLSSRAPLPDERGLWAVDSRLPFPSGPEPPPSEPGPIASQRGSAVWHPRQVPVSADGTVQTRGSVSSALGYLASQPGSSLVRPDIVNRMVAPLSGLPAIDRSQTSPESTVNPPLSYVREPRGMLSPFLDGDFTGAWAPPSDGEVVNAPVRYHDPQLGNGALARLVDEIYAALSGSAFGAFEPRRSAPLAFGEPSLDVAWRKVARDDW